MSNTTAVLAGALIALSPAVPAHHHGGGTTSLRLTLTHPGRTASSTHTVTLRCDPPGGRHPDPARACSELDGSGGKFAHAPDGRMWFAASSGALPRTNFNFMVQAPVPTARMAPL